MSVVFCVSATQKSKSKKTSTPKNTYLRITDHCDFTIAMFCTKVPSVLQVMILLAMTLFVETTDPNQLTPESLAEKYPYVVALLDSTRKYICTGTIFSRNTVLSSGHCIIRQPSFVAVGLAVLWPQTNNNSIFEISSVELHHDYVFELRAPTYNLSTLRFHSNIGVAIVKGPQLTMYIQPPPLRKIGIEEMKHKVWVVVGYGKSKEHPTMTALRQEVYEWTPCHSTQWYYCICGSQRQDSALDEPFGEGGPLIFDSQYLLAVAALPCGALKLSKNGFKYNIFTVVTPYVAWIKNAPFFDREDVKVEMQRSVMVNGAVYHRNLSNAFKATCIVLSVFNLCK